ncbi:hypothetical protein [Geminisphaera colitermitum]|uniref:hypothetical protein n=1 Tax=Geminisphaera colitermitum TaxID=1148786 RepID=UPI0001965314|nr:hypothetical protein [Geminisphaera colitermitum]
MKIITETALFPAIIMGFAAPHLSAAIIATDFSAESAFTGNYKVMTSNTHLTWNSGGYVQGQQGTNWFGYALYTTTPSGNGYTNNSFLEETLSLTFSHSVLGTTPATTIVSRVNSETNLGVYARVYLGHGNINNVRIQLGWGFDVTTNSTTGGQILLDVVANVSSGNAVYNTGINSSGVTVNSGHTLAAGTEYKAIFEQKNDASGTASFALSIYNSANDLLISTGWQSNATLNAAAGNAGSVGFGSSTNTANGPNKYYSLEITSIPETSSTAILLSVFAVGICLVVRKSRLKR